MKLTFAQKLYFMEYIWTFCAFLIGFVIVFIVVPPILRVAHAKQLFEPFEERKIHTKIVPPLGGVAIFIGFILSTILATNGLSFDSLKYIIAAIILMFFIGLKDDLVNISARKKLVIQIFAALILITMGNIRFTNLHGILGTYDIGYITSTTVSLFSIVVIINAFNLIDGIDGLAAGISMVAATVFGVWFFIAGHFEFAIMSFALVGSLTCYFIYNVFGNKNKLFMGDTGSLIIGLILSIFVIEFNEFNIVKTTTFAIGSAPAVSFAILIVPLIDTLRVMTIRIKQRQSPFTADNNHIHHRLLSLYRSHLKVTIIIVSANVIIIAFALLLNHTSLNNNIQLLIVFLTGIMFSFIPSILINFRNLKKTKGSRAVKQVS